MNSKVTLKEIVGTKIIYAALLACYYWMWARRDWHDYYDTIQNAVVLFTIVFFLLQATRVRKYHKEETDAIGLKIMIASAIVIAFACAVGAIDASAAGYALVGTILALAVIRFIIFCVMDSKGV